jgi:hypothetical protein
VGCGSTSAQAREQKGALRQAEIQGAPWGDGEDTQEPYFKSEAPVSNAEMPYPSLG